MNRINTYSSLAVASFISASLMAAEQSTRSQTATGDIVVTATRTAESADAAIAPVSVITRQDIERLQATSVKELLATTPGLDFTSNGGYGSLQSFFLRGTNSDHVLVLVDGIPVGSATSGTTAFEFIPVSQIERIEVVRGPRSSIYGANAIGGVIQIFTRNNEGKKTAYINAGYGNENTREVNAGLSGGNDRGNYALGLGYFDTDGYNIIGKGIDADDDGYDNYSVTLNGNYQLTDKLKFGGSFIRSEGTTEFDGYQYKNTRSEYLQQVVSATVDYQVTSSWDSRLRMGRSEDNLDSQLHNNRLANPFVTPRTRIDTTKDSLTWQNDILINDSDLLTLGLDYLDESVDGTTEYTRDSRWNHAAFIQYQFFGDVIDAKLSYRYDKNQAYGSFDSWDIGIGFPINNQLRLTSSYGTAFKAPSFNDLYWPNDGWFVGNPDLKPEESKNFDLGLQLEHESTKWTLNYFDTKIDDLIAYDALVFPATMNNVKSAKINGLELTLATRLFDWAINSNLTLMDPTDLDTGYQLARRSKQLFRFEADRQQGQLSYGASVIAASQRYNDGQEQDSIPGYGILNIRAAYDLNRHWKIKGKIDNLLDKEYALTRDFFGNDYRAQGRFAFVSLHYQQ